RARRPPLDQPRRPRAGPGPGRGPGRRRELPPARHGYLPPRPGHRGPCPQPGRPRPWQVRHHDLKGRSMPTIAIVGAGPGLGLSIARVFGRHDFSVALVSRSQEKLDGLVAELGESGVDAAGFAADVTDRPSLAAAFARITERLGRVDVLEYSPA